MENPLLANLRRDRENWQTQLDAIVKRAADENRQELTPDETKNVTDIRTALGPLDDRIRTLSKDESDRLAFLETARKLDRQAAGLPPETHRSTSHEGPARSWGEQFVESGAIDDYLKGGGMGKSRAITLPGTLLRQSTPPGNPIMTTALGDFVNEQLLPGIIQPFEPPTVLSLVRRGTTTASAIQYISEDGFTNNAALVPEGTVKPQSTLAFTSHTVVVETKAHWVAITRQALADIPMIRSYIDGRLRDGLVAKIADEVLNGDVGGAPGLLTEAQTVSAADLWEAVIMGGLAIQNAGYNPTGIVCNGADFYSLLLSLRNSLGGAGTSLITDALPYRMNGLPLLVTPGMPAGTALIGDFAQAQLFDRQATQVLVSDNVNDAFIRNITVLLAEWRGALAIFAPSAFVKATITGASGAGNGGGDTRVGGASGPLPAQHERRRTGA